ncbi:hypothetical protein CYMTET_22013 [Cymbomonas tetramitiformis]|uniref:Uncharacterized protein n=1 Tax=Cymbomonas tetramitiformis TaxID=36881 RepID=A0AAE0G1P1_9CHLO|nr:hypothetical protein CYMTET_22013 [Cymbomonas tetramitiformis]
MFKSILAAVRQIENYVKGVEQAYHANMDCPYGGKKAPAGTVAAFCIPIEDCEEDAYTLTVCPVFQQASDCGASAFAAAERQHGGKMVIEE